MPHRRQSALFMPNHASQKAVLPQSFPNHASTQPLCGHHLLDRRNYLGIIEIIETAPIMPKHCPNTAPKRRWSTTCMWINMQGKYCLSEYLSGNTTPIMPQYYLITGSFRKGWLNMWYPVIAKYAHSSPSVQGFETSGDFCLQWQRSPLVATCAAGLMLFAGHSNWAKFAICHKFVGFWLVESASTIHFIGVRLIVESIYEKKGLNLNKFQHEVF
jgi:hypothetical protein